MENEAMPQSEELINVRDPDTDEIGSIPASQLQHALSQGYSHVSPDEVKEYVKRKEFETPGQQLVTGVEGALSAATFGASTGISSGLGITTPERQQARREINPGDYMFGQGVGLAASSAIPGLGAANILEDVGKGAAELAGLGEATSGAAKIGSSAVKMAAENALFQAGDETSKMFSQDPNQTLQTAVTDVGLSGLIGGGFGIGVGSISPLWGATAGPKVEQFLKMFSDKANGIEGIASDQMARSMDKLGMDVPAEIKAAYSDNPYIRQTAKTLEQTDSNTSGLEFQKALKDHKAAISNKLVESLGRTSEDVSADLSPYESGKKIGSTLAEEFKAQVDPLAEKFEKIKEQYADTPLMKDQVVESSKMDPYLGSSSEKTMIPGTTSQIAEKIANLAHEEGWYSSPSSEIMTEVNRVIKELPKQDSLKDLTNYITQIGNNTYDFTNPQLTRAGMLMKNIVRDAESEVITKALGEKAPELVAEHAAARAAWAKAASLKDSLQDRLHLGGGNSPTSFIKNLQESAQSDGEKILRRLSGVNDSALLETLQEKFPQTAELIRQYNIDQLLRKNSAQVGDSRIIKANQLMKAVDKMSPEMKNFVLPPQALENIQAASGMLHHLEELPHNFSGTARTMDKLLNNFPGVAVALVSVIAGHPGAALILGPLTKYLAKDMPDAIRLGMLKFLGSSKQIDSEGFKAMVDLIQHTIKGENLISKASKAIFKSGVEVLPQAVLPSEKETEKLDKRLKALQSDPKPLLDIGGKAGHYLPEHVQAMGQTASNAVNYLNSIRPNVDKKAPLDQPMEPSKAQKAAFTNALQIAEQPLILMDKIKMGTLTPQDLVHMNALYPQLHQKLVQKLTDQMTEALTKEVKIPYKTRMGLSLFMGQPLDSTMTAEAIQAAQPKMAQPSQIGEAMQRKSAPHSMTALNKMPGMYQTPQQSRESHRMR